MGVTTEHAAIDPVPPLPDLSPDLGVKFLPPPDELLPAINEQLEKGTAGLKPGEMAIVGIATKAGWNGAVVGKLPGQIDVMTWIGSKWGEPIDYGVVVRKKFKFGGR